MMSESSLKAALRHFEAIEINLVKLENVLAEIDAAIPIGIDFIDNHEYDTNCRIFDTLLAALPKIDAWKPDIYLFELDWIAQQRFDACEIDEIDYINFVEQEIAKPNKLLREYRYRFSQKRRELLRKALLKLLEAIDAKLQDLVNLLELDNPQSELITIDVL